MDLRRVAGGFLAVLGGMMIAVWLILLVMGQVPEARTAPIRLTFLLAAEMATAVLSLVSGAGLVMHRSWAAPLYPVATGMMLYSITNYLGVLAETGPLPVVLLFAGFLVLTIFFLFETADRRRSPAAAAKMIAGSSP